MHVISIKHIRGFYETHSDAEEPLKAWLREAQIAKWETPQDIKDQYSSASFLANKRVVFNIKGNTFRLVVAVAYRFSAVYVKFIGTHAEYDEINAVTVEMK